MANASRAFIGYRAISTIASATIDDATIDKHNAGPDNAQSAADAQALITHIIGTNQKRNKAKPFYRILKG